MKKVFILTMIVFVLFGTALCFGASQEKVQSADALYELGLFKGTGVNADGTPEYALDKVPTRQEAVAMLVRLLGKETEATSQAWTTPFTDVANWAKPYVGYAYNNGLTNGISSDKFGSNASATETQYLSFVLRALGYSDKAGDFAWNEAKNLTDRIGITSSLNDASGFDRGTVAEVSYNALDAALKDSEQKLSDKLISDGVFTAETLENVQSAYSKANELGSTADDIVIGEEKLSFESVEYEEEYANLRSFTLKDISVAYSSKHSAYVLKIDYSSSFDRGAYLFNEGRKKSDVEGFGFPFMLSESASTRYKLIPADVWKNYEGFVIRLWNETEQEEANFIYLYPRGKSEAQGSSSQGVPNTDDIVQGEENLSFESVEYEEDNANLKDFTLKGVSVAYSSKHNAYVLKIDYSSALDWGASLFNFGMRDPSEGFGFSFMLSESASTRYKLIPADVWKNYEGFAIKLWHAGVQGEANMICIYPQGKSPNTDDIVPGEENLSFEAVEYEENYANLRGFTLKDVSVAYSSKHSAYVLRIDYSSAFDRKACIFNMGRQDESEGFGFAFKLSESADTRYKLIPKDVWKNYEGFVIRLWNETKQEEANFIYIYHKGK